MPEIEELEADPKTGWSRWVWIKRKFRQICCQCGTAHDWDFKIIDGKLYWRARENKRSTAAIRRKKKK